MLATTRAPHAPDGTSVAQRRPAGRARIASPKRPSAGLLGALRNRAVDTSKPRRAHRAVVVRAGTAMDGRDVGVANLAWDLVDEGTGDLGANAARIRRILRRVEERSQ